VGCDICGLVKVPSGVLRNLLSPSFQSAVQVKVLVYQTACCHMLQDCDIMRRFVYNSVYVSGYLFCLVSYSNDFGHI